MRPKKLNATDAAQYFQCARTTVYDMIRGDGLQPDAEGRYDVGRLESAAETHTRGVFDMHPDSPASLWRAFFNADLRRASAMCALRRLPKWGDPFKNVFRGEEEDDAPDAGAGGQASKGEDSPLSTSTK